MIKGKNVIKALTELDFLVKRASDPIKKLLLSAIANAKTNFSLEKEKLVIKSLQVDKGVTMKRMNPVAMGRGHRINKRTSNLNLLLAEK